MKNHAVPLDAEHPPTMPPRHMDIDVHGAYERLRRYLPATPLHYAERFDCWLKLENLQRTGSYKVRGALNALLAAKERGDDRPVIAASAGNHAQGVAWAAHRTGIQALTVMPNNAPRIKVQGVARWGARVCLHGHSYDEAAAHACRLAEYHGYRYLSPFDDPDVIAGQGTVGIELIAMAPQIPDTVIVPIGGGGLAAGVGLALRTYHGRRVRIVGAQVAGVNAMDRLLRGEPLSGEPAATLADGVRVREPGTLTRHLLQDLLDDLVVVSEAELGQTVARLATDEHLVAEGAGALALAAATRIRGANKCAIISGGNIDPRVLASLLVDI